MAWLSPRHCVSRRRNHDLWSHYFPKITVLAKCELTAT